MYTPPAVNKTNPGTIQRESVTELTSLKYPGSPSLVSYVQMQLIYPNDSVTAAPLI